MRTLSPMRFMMSSSVDSFADVSYLYITVRRPWSGKEQQQETDLATATTLAMSSELPSMIQSSPWSSLCILFRASKLELISGRESTVEAPCLGGCSLVSGEVWILCGDMVLGLEMENSLSPSVTVSRVVPLVWQMQCLLHVSLAAAREGVYAQLLYRRSNRTVR